MDVERRNFHVFLLMGQSNMAGYGCVRPEDPWQAGDRDPLPRAFVLTGQDPHVAFVETDGLPSPPGDNAHFNREAPIELGRRYGAAMLAVAG